MNEPFDFEDEILLRSDYDPEQDAWFARLLFWRPSKLSDDQMQLHFREWDGRWSEQTKRAWQRLGAKGLDLNENWALCEPYWACPACYRSKENIFRLSKRGILLAKLELHHDHMRDAIWSRARELFGADWRDAAPKTSLVLLDYIRELTSRFDRCLLCSECNTADAKVKSRFRAEIDSGFSFTAQEIGTFVRPQVSQDHSIDYEKAHAAWKLEKGNFLSRVALIDELLAGVVNGRLTRDPQGMASTRRMAFAFDERSLLLQAFNWDTKNTERASLLWGLRDEFLARSTQRDSAKLPALSGGDKFLVVPTDEEYAAYIDPVSPKNWQGTSEDWTCPICNRGKRHIVRKSKAGKWTGSIRFHNECTLETDSGAIQNRRRLFPDFPNDVFVRRIAFIALCSDCANIGSALGQRDQNFRNPYLGIDDREACITRIQAHAAHEIDFEVASRRAIDNQPYEAAISAFYAFCERASDFVGRLERGLKWGVTKEALLKEFVEDLQVFHRIVDERECEELAQWILTQSRSLSENAI
ncbi:MAG: hypothetical protein WCE79_26725 [Xanthobacteraceae bacterium]